MMGLDAPREGIDYYVRADNRKYLLEPYADTLTIEEKVRFLLEEGNWTEGLLAPCADLHEEAVRQRRPPEDSVNRML